MAGRSAPVAGELARAAVTAREAEVLAAVALRLSNREIADRLHLSTRTVESHVSALLRKLQAADRRELVRLGLRLRRDAPTGEIPRPVTSFVGRRRELAELSDLLVCSALLTLTGPGGVGKTRLASQVALDSASHYTDGTGLVDLAALGAGDPVEDALAHALGVPEQPGRPIGATLRDAVAHMEVLLVADNCEHVLDDVAGCLADLLPAGRLRVLATSREPLALPGEVTYQVYPLPVPGPRRPAAPAAPEALGECDAVRLFVDRAAAATPGFTLTPGNAVPVAELCRRLDGLPLALELAAARVRAFSPQQLVAHLDRRFELLSAGARTAPARHRTLAATIEWSYETLDPDERVLFERLAVFPGTFDYAAVEAVCAGPPLDPAAVIAAFPRLLDKSLVSGQALDDGGLRYRLLETVRAYARDRLPDRAAVELAGCLAAHYLTVAETTAPLLKGPQQRSRRGQLAAEEPNLRAALAWSIARGRTEESLRLFSALALYWDDTGRRREAGEWIDRILAAEDPPATPTTVDALVRASLLHQASDVARAHRLAQTAEQLAHGLGDRERAVAALGLGWALAYQGRVDDAVTALRRSLAFFTAQDHPWERAMTLQGLALATADLDEGVAHAQQAVALFERLGDRSRLANTLYTMADGALNTGRRLGDAEVWLRESLAVSEDAGTDHDRAHALLGLARVAWRRGAMPEVKRLLSECLPVLRRLGDQRCAGRSLYMLGEIAARDGEPVRAGELLRDSIEAAEPAADVQTLERARQALASLRG